jgi:energy-coupling factor transport system ATP-binding protein
MQPYIELKDVSFEYKIHGLETLTAVDSVSLSVPKGSHVAILGRNGSGKSTLARLINGLEMPNSGQVFVDGILLNSEKNAWEIRKKCGIVFQNPDNQIIGTTVEEDVAFGPENLGMPREQMIIEIDKALRAVGLQDKKRTAPHLLSGGQKQKLAIAGILAMSPGCFILDEATSMLDPQTRKDFMTMITGLVKERGMTIINITHHMEEAIMADYVYVMSSGKIVKSGTPKEVFEDELLLRAEGLDIPVHMEIVNMVSQLTGIQKQKFSTFTSEDAKNEIYRICSDYIKSKLEKHGKSEFLEIMNSNDFDILNINKNINSSISSNAFTGNIRNGNTIKDSEYSINDNTVVNNADGGHSAIGKDSHGSYNGIENNSQGGHSAIGKDSHGSYNGIENNSQGGHSAIGKDSHGSHNGFPKNSHDSHARDVKPVLSVTDLSYTYARETIFASDALKNISFDIYPGELFGIVGQTGSGKSTLVQHFNGLLKPQTGKVVVMDYDTSQKASIRAIRKRAGLLFQYPEHQLFEETVSRDIAFGPRCLGMSEDEISKAVDMAIEVVGLDSSFLEKSPFELSGGQKRRVAIAGIVSMKPDILILDEPAAGLDPGGREEILSFVKRLCESGTTVVLVSHNMDDIARLADRVLVLKDGDVMSCTTPGELFSSNKTITAYGLSLPLITEFMNMIKEDYPELKTTYYNTSDCAKEIFKTIADSSPNLREKGGEA